MYYFRLHCEMRNKDIKIIIYIIISIIILLLLAYYNHFFVISIFSVIIYIYIIDKRARKCCNLTR